MGLIKLVLRFEKPKKKKSIPLGGYCSRCCSYAVGTSGRLLGRVSHAWEGARTAA